MYSNESERADEDSYFDFKLKKNTVQALKYPSADAVPLYMPGLKAIS